MAALLADWHAIAGPALASFTIPAKLSMGAAKAQSNMRTDRPPAHLLLKVDPARALEVQYMVPQLIERINQSLGYNAVASIRLMQAPLAPAPKKRIEAMKAPLVPLAGPPAPEGNRLDQALARMRRGIDARKPNAVTSG